MIRHLDRFHSVPRAGASAGVFLEAMENRVLFAVTPPVLPPAPPAPKPGVVLDKGVLRVGGALDKENTIKVSLSLDAKSVNVLVNGQAKSFKAEDVTDVLVAGGPKNDNITVYLGAAKLKHAAVTFGLAGNDTIMTGKQADLIFAGSGNDHVISGAGADVIHAGPGHDVVHAGDGDDKLFGDKEDLLDGGAGKNEIHRAPPPKPVVV